MRSAVVGVEAFQSDQNGLKESANSSEEKNKRNIDQKKNYVRKQPFGPSPERKFLFLFEYFPYEYLFIQLLLFRKFSIFKTILFDILLSLIIPFILFPADGPKHIEFYACFQNYRQIAPKRIAITASLGVLASIMFKIPITLL